MSSHHGAVRIASSCIVASALVAGCWWNSLAVYLVVDHPCFSGLAGAVYTDERAQFAFGGLHLCDIEMKEAVLADD